MKHGSATAAGLVLTGSNLTLADAERVLTGQVERLSIAADARKRVDRSRACLERLIATSATIYGVNTGFGKLANTRIEADEVLALQENLLRSHAVGMGPLLSIGVSRLALALRIQALVKGYSGVTSALIETLIEMYNRGVVPAIPEQGSVGASGDLAPLAHLALVVMGEGHAFVTHAGANGAKDGRRLKPLSGRAALRRVHLQPHRPLAKEGLSLINGTQISTAILADALIRAQNLAKIADVAGAMTVDAIKCSQKPFDARLQKVRPHPGQAACAANLRTLLEASQIMVSHAHCDKVQDAYSIRCMPQVHGTLRDAITHVAGIVECEMNSATDNPLVFADTDEVISGGNFHAQPIALAADHLAAAVADLSSISERRVENLVNPDLSGLPGFLTPHPGLNSGMMLVQVLAAALVSENKAAAYPASVDSIPTSANREDHVSMSTTAARKCRTIVVNATRVLASELLCAAQGLEFHKPLKPGKGVAAAYEHIRQQVRPLGRDRTLHRDLEAVERLIRSGSLLAAVEKDCGQLQ
ncbi:MAG TPA: histidine ammonia-lyase [Gemmataceae bacterium]|jgi:histidine ammonia-lyase|nr:histidine ammonia-lyase [Gemmataceae bacterium]